MTYAGLPFWVCLSRGYRVPLMGLKDGEAREPSTKRLFLLEVAANYMQTTGDGFRSGEPPLWVSCKQTVGECMTSWRVDNFWTELLGIGDQMEWDKPSRLAQK